MIIIDVIGRKIGKILQLILFIAAVIIFHTFVIDSYNTGFLLAPCIVGYYSKDVEDYVESKKMREYCLLIVFVLFFSLQCFWDNRFNVWNLGCNVFQGESFVNNCVGMLFRFAIGMLGTIVAKKVFDFIITGIQNCDSLIVKLIDESVTILGKNTEEVYILQCWVIAEAGAAIVRRVVQYLGFNPFVYNVRLLVFVIGPMVTTLSLVCMYYAQKYIKKIPYIGSWLFHIPLVRLFPSLKK